MLRPTAIKVVPLNDFLLQVTFDNGEIKDFDVKPYIKGKWYGELANKAYFSCASADGYSIKWPNGQDICPDELYYCSKKE
ncbi:MAG: DUF2442 domain-containing protein [Sphaerochaetaceae bacterium]|jgi:hypothetical protein|nr:DUF2442 domain-containing protein [Sphaerochaetaceae bacterium]MDD3164059.1 DUF2442 domain-containing protein [Sphaerochaetaceae bacterium]MDD4397824.1 DUF2442 domain-containing protein [Sphaerochaetaceae bacterium]